MVSYITYVVHHLMRILQIEHIVQSAQCGFNYGVVINNRLRTGACLQSKCSQKHSTDKMS